MTDSQPDSWADTFAVSTGSRDGIAPAHNTLAAVVRAMCFEKATMGLSWLVRAAESKLWRTMGRTKILPQAQTLIRLPLSARIGSLGKSLELCYKPRP